jgi:MoxR-like ATPase
MATESIARAQLEQVAELSRRVSAEVGKAYLGAAETCEALLTCLLARGHVLLEGVPGVAKTTLVKAFAQATGCAFRRIQFTPDLLPSDITGTYVLDRGGGQFVLRPGPIFAQVVLGDEINRAPAKTQSALLEAMQEGQVTIEGQTLRLEPPFMVLATQNPIEHEGTYPLPEAQLDRFLIKLQMRYPEQAVEKQMLITYSRPLEELARVLAPADVLTLQKLADAVHVEDELYEYVLELVRYTRGHRRVYLGASPRAALALVHAARARALVGGRDFVLPDDVKRLAVPVLAHRLLPSGDAELRGVSGADVIGELLTSIPVPGATG